jgi:hypothetical protein
MKTLLILLAIIILTACKDNPGEVRPDLNGTWIITYQLEPPQKEIVYYTIIDTCLTIAHTTWTRTWAGAFTDNDRSFLGVGPFKNVLFVKMIDDDHLTGSVGDKKDSPFSTKFAGERK